MNYVVEESVCRDNRLVLPLAARQDIIAKLHSVHYGFQASLVTARLHYFWSGMTAQITDIITKCETYAQNQNQQPNT